LLLFELKSFRIMKNFRMKISVFAIALGSVIALTQSAFTPAGKRFATQYQFNGTSLADDKNAANYSAVSSPTCGGTAMPCVISVPTGTTLTAWLAARTPEQIRDQAVSQKN
jgi:hypothetical protein